MLSNAGIGKIVIWSGEKPRSAVPHGLKSLNINSELSEKVSEDILKRELLIILKFSFHFPKSFDGLLKVDLKSI